MKTLIIATIAILAIYQGGARAMDAAMSSPTQTVSYGSQSR